MTSLKFSADVKFAKSKIVYIKFTKMLKVATFENWLVNLICELGYKLDFYCQLLKRRKKILTKFQNLITEQETQR